MGSEIVSSTLRWEEDEVVIAGIDVEFVHNSHITLKQLV